MKFIKLFAKILILIIGFFVVGTFLLNEFFYFTEKRSIKSEEEVKDEEADAILVLGCSVYSNMKPSKMLEERLNKVIEVYNNNPTKIIVSGDHSEYYNEVEVMKNYLVEAGIPSSDIFMDHEGYSTYASVYRAVKKFGAERLLIITQEYHLYRALYIADAMGIEAIGVAAEGSKYKGQIWRGIREIFARDKDFVQCIFLPKDKGDLTEVSLASNGNATNEKEEN